MSASTSLIASDGQEAAASRTTSSGSISASTDEWLTPRVGVFRFGLERRVAGVAGTAPGASSGRL